MQASMVAELGRRSTARALGRQSRPSVWHLNVLGLLFAAAAEASPHVTLDDSDWHLAVSGDVASAGLRAALLDWHEAWAARDLNGCARLLAGDVLRATQSQSVPEIGRDAVLAALPREWSALEKDAAGGSALKMALRHVYARVDQDAALLRYYAEVSGGTRWEFEDTAAFTTLWRRRADGSWQLLFQADAWGLDVDAQTGASGSPTFSFDYALPVTDLARAIEFYTPLLGAPEAQVGGVAAFQLNGSRLYLDSTSAAPGKGPRYGLPNGWPIILPVDVAQAQQRAQAAGVEFVGAAQDFGGYRVQYGFEPGGNLIAVGAVAPLPEHPAPPAQLQADPARPTAVAKSVVTAELAYQRAWLAGDIDAAMDALQPDAALLDATRSRTHGWAVGAKAVRRRLSNSAPSATSAARATSRMHLTALHAVSAGPWVATTRQRTLVGLPPWNRQSHALQSLIFDTRDAGIVVALAAESARGTALGLEFDYAGLPATEARWDEVARALRALTGARDSYRDEGWLGLWGERAVLGLFAADPAVDGLPRQRAAATYLSMWVSDVHAALKFARDAGAGLPRIPAINDRAGIDRNPGYTQVYLSDSEGNGVVLTEYTGRRGR